MAYSKSDLKRIAGDVYSNFESITGVSLAQISFHANMDADFAEATVYLVDEWVRENYPGTNVLGRHEEILTELDSLLAQHT